jgi:hypothetical protein
VRDIELDDEPGPNLEGKAETLKANPKIDQTNLIKTSEKLIITQYGNL